MHVRDFKVQLWEMTLYILICLYLYLHLAWIRQLQQNFKIFQQKLWKFCTIPYYRNTNSMPAPWNFFESFARGFFLGKPRFDWFLGMHAMTSRYFESSGIKRLDLWRTCSIRIWDWYYRIGLVSCTSYIHLI